MRERDILIQDYKDEFRNIMMMTSIKTTLKNDKKCKLVKQIQNVIIFNSI